MIGYRIYRSTNQNITGELIGYLEAGDNPYLSYRNSNVKLGFEYYYSVVAIDRMDFESEPEIESIILKGESIETVIEDNEEQNSFIYIGGGIMSLAALGAGYYVFSNRGINEETLSSVAEIIDEADASKSNFTEIDGELLCSACGSMFTISDEKVCPSCGVFDE